MEPWLKVFRGVVPPEVSQAALRLINRDLFKHGISAREIEWWSNQVCWFPHLRNSPEIQALAEAIPDEYRQGTLCEPQIILSFPEIADDDAKIFPHVDQEPPWAQGRKYLTICGIPLSSSNPNNGGLHVWNDDHTTYCPTLNVGDLLVMSPAQRHSRGYNRTGEIRYKVYFRYLQN